MLTDEDVHVNNDVQGRVNQEHCENIGKLGIDIYIYNEYNLLAAHIMFMIHDSCVSLSVYEATYDA